MNKILLLDISAILYTSYNAISLNRSDGVHSGALYGFLNLLKKLIKTYDIKYVIAAMDVSRKTLKRTQIYSEYKSHRKEMDQDLLNQFNEIYYFLEALNIPYYKQEGEEADDILASLAEILKKDSNNDIYIYTGDKDLCQILDNNVKILRKGKLNKKTIIKEYKSNEDVLNEFGVYPYQIPDLLGLIGDSSDGIPGVSGIGEKIAPFLKEYGSIEKIYENYDNISLRTKKNLLGNIEIAKLSRELAIVNRNIKLEINLENCLFCNTLSDKFNELCKKWEFTSFSKDFLNFFYTNKIQKLDKIDIDNKDKVYFYECEYGAGILCENEFNIFLDDDKESLFSNSINKDEINDILCKKFSKKEIIVYNIKQALHNDYKFVNYKDISIIYHLVEENQDKTLDGIYEKYYGKRAYELSVRDIKKLDSLSLKEYKERYIKERLKYIENIYNDIIFKFYEDEKLVYLYENIEKPLINVLYDMEKYGIKIDINYLENLKKEFEKIISGYKEKIYELSGEEFNIDSPKQIGEILFEKLGCPIIKKTKSGYSTDNEVLDNLSKFNFEIADYILKYRLYNKLLSSYLQPLLSKVDENDRIHTTFYQNGTSTGRLSSENPNLQVIPTRTKEGNLIRKGLIAKTGYTLLSCDYSQVELRILASMSQDEKLISSYEKELDLHEVTARTIFNKSDNDEISREERDLAKIINFSVLYGKTPFGLSKELNISIQTASTYIKNYFNTYKRVGEFIEEIINNAKKYGYVETLFGTKRYIPDINSTNKNIFEQAKRMAVNTVIQGTASNILKKVMIELQSLLSDDIRLLIQIHDELIFEIKDEKLEEIIPKILKIMENTVQLENVKLKVHYRYGTNWSELK